MDESRNTGVKARSFSEIDELASVEGGLRCTAATNG